VAEEANFELMIDVFGPDDKQIGAFKQPVTIPAQNKRTRTIVQMDALPLVGAGQYIFKISAQTPEADSATRYAELPLDIKVPRTES
jgi:hypothetical protein